MNATHIENVVTKLRRTIGSGQEKAETSDLWEASAKLTTILTTIVIFMNKVFQFDFS